MAEPSYRKQEQEPASADVSEVAEGVLRLMLPVELPGLGHVNCYALEDERGFALVDPGLPGDDSWTVLLSRLASAGIPLHRVHTTVITHSHVDHFGGSDQLREETGAEILTHEAFETSWGHGRADDLDLDLLDVDEDELVEVWKRRWETMDRNEWGTRRTPPPEQAIRRWLSMGDAGLRRFRAPDPTVLVTDGDPVALARREWFAVHTPGHTIDHLCLWDPEGGVLLSGDHILPTITPHIAGSTALEDPLASFFGSLDRVGRLEGATAVLPAHGHPFDNLAERAESIRVHHNERLDVLRQAGADLVDTPVEGFMRVLFNERVWGDMAASETYAHLEHLTVVGEATRRRDDEGLVRYTITPAGPANDPAHLTRSAP